tara:strand:- start:111 stop:1208 length:1098 start_codon:yes stop_codon:yes gene_type:complete
MSLSIVFSTKKINEDFVKLIKSTCGVHNVEILPYENPGKYSLNEVYNMGLKKATNDKVVFCHDDIKFDTKNWGRKMLKNFSKHPDFGIIGVAGTRYLSTTGRWWDDFSKMHGAVYHEKDGNRWLTRYSKDIGLNLMPVVLVDGLFFGVSKSKLVKHFDESIKGFHFYDVEFCFSNFLENVKIGVCTNVRITHLSIGQTNDEWEKNREVFAEKYKDKLPVKMNRPFYDNEKFDILISTVSLNEEIMDLSINIKKLGHNLSLLCEHSSSHKKFLNRKGIDIHPINTPPGFKMGDGEWALSGPKGPIQSEKGKLYKMKEIKFDVIHTTDNQLMEYMKNFFPNTPQFNSDDEVGLKGDLIKKYKKVLEW